MIRSIIKRDGRVVLYDESKIASAILKAMEAAGEGDATDAANVANDVQSKLEKLPEDMPPQIEQVQDTVERALMKKGCEESAKKFILYRAQRTHIREANTSLMKTIDEITNIDARESDMIMRILTEILLWEACSRLERQERKIIMRHIC